MSEPASFAVNANGSSANVPDNHPVLDALVGWRAGLGYGALGLPLAFVALPLYVVLPNHYATHFGVPLAALGGVLLGARLVDAVADPLIGRAADGWLATGAHRTWWAMAMAPGALASGISLRSIARVSSRVNQRTASSSVWSGVALSSETSAISPIISDDG